MVRLSDAALAQLDVARGAFVARGDIWWIPAELVFYRGDPKERPCLVVADDAAHVYLIPGTSKRASGPAVRVEPGETDLLIPTEFDFSAFFTLSRTALAADGKFVGSIATTRLDEIDTAIAHSTLIAVKRAVRT